MDSFREAVDALQAMTENSFLLLVPVISAWLAGSLIGLEREYHGRPAGFRTHALVCVASALLMVAMEKQLYWLGDLPKEIVRTDPTRMAQAIMMGIGFLCAGVIFKEGLAVRGLTTSASIWITAVVGILYGIGFWVPAVAGTLIVIITLWLFERFERMLTTGFEVFQTLKFPKDHVPEEDEVKRIFTTHDFKIHEISYSLAEGGDVFEYYLSTMTRKRKNITELVGTLRTLPHILEFRVESRNE
ncbi:MAG: MgtC/SapB family protein [Rhodospirillales bacterium]